MIIDIFLYKNDKLHKKNLNIKAYYDKTTKRLEFNEEKVHVIIEFNEGIIYKRIDNEYDFHLMLNNESSYSKLNLKDLNHSLDIKILDYSYKVENNFIEIIYRLETEEKTTNKIIIEMKASDFNERNNQKCDSKSIK